MSVHDELRALAASARPETLPGDDIDSLLRHADACPDCSAELRDFAARAVVAQAPALTLEPAHAERLRRRILAPATPAPEPAPPQIPRKPARATLALGGGWLAAASLAVALLTHHGFHEPLSSGWLIAAAFALLALGVTIYALAQRSRAEALEFELRSRERGRTD
jgi:anti-sigma factor RsiW